MRIFELRKQKEEIKVQTQYDWAYEQLMDLKGRGETAEPNNSLQLFVPRKIKWRPQTKKGMRDYILRDQPHYAYDDEGNLKPEYQKMVDNAEHLIVDESAPVLSKIPIRNSHGFNKPMDSFWTSTAMKFDNGKYTSDWNNFVLRGGGPSSWKSKIGYLYKVKPRTCSLELSSNYDCRNIYEIFNKLERENAKMYDQPENYFETETYLMRKDFPWQEIAKNFDCVHHDGMSSISYFGSSFSGDNFLYGWDVESTAWLNPERLELLGQVPLITEVSGGEY